MKLPLWMLSALVFGATPANARENLGIFGDWGAFRDDNIPRCYAIAQADDGRGYASIGTWPLKNVRGQLHIRLSQSAAESSTIFLSAGSRRFALTGRGANAWARDARMDAAIVASLRSAPTMTVSFRDTQGARVRDRYDLPGIASAMDAATVACARRG